ncbi:DegT/DnrJ/EryC1/StrS family aminotransferase [Flavobacteriaceae bacterium]|jgi:UDP-2-acetamido-2-deoxy-ribo-hexuluronate aminotransferase|nr:DegT/DnrJ/EryC1/StrS family aminotransferase [Flavobacteriaceae bacterium]MBT4313994.1 DegT/DnrJ/EryC1/StrS family aminotransferase [Flavobacteriaceae bacterium]MBT5091144.1 DegT/DnrJ/EryC1/StrS family aminotransferase [Flavobacteriaceae bacterium]MBT5282731.1 DegT/DnrJ/EryC1/StrS family aminotransferase [Flavobacteriaceae bacterium]MBT5446816.1 DegT/DnrJ/EryC1/StrS family aminotransferase [Flavobacteriaceae bacterium]|tara:strand:+ start:15098 stop:16234 length:1137 start_codon:yes stop_codon:yes gene_type:complete
MKKIQMVDLKSQYAFIRNEVQASIEEVLDTTSYINGPAVKSFQEDLQEYLGVKHVIPCANGTDALQIALMGLKLKPGDEVITADFTFAATVEVISLLQLKPVLVDVDSKTFNIDPALIEAAITPKTKAIIPVHLFGQIADMDAINSIAKKHNLYVVEDNAQGIGARYGSVNDIKTMTGTLGHVAATSFFPSKNLGAYGDGGAIITNDDDLAHFIRGIVNHGMYERYYHDVVGVNSRLDSIQAAVLKVKLKYLDFYNERRKEASIRYTNLLSNHPNIITPHRKLACDSHVFHQYTLRIINADRDALVAYLNTHDIPCGVYYPVPLHRQKAYADPEVNEASFPVTNQLVKEVISLPMHSELTTDQIAFISGKVLSFLKEN